MILEFSVFLIYTFLVYFSIPFSKLFFLLPIKRYNLPETRRTVSCQRKILRLHMRGFAVHSFLWNSLGMQVRVSTAGFRAQLQRVQKSFRPQAWEHGGSSLICFVLRRVGCSLFRKSFQEKKQNFSVPAGKVPVVFSGRRALRFPPRRGDRSVRSPDDRRGPSPTRPLPDERRAG